MCIRDRPVDPAPGRHRRVSPPASDRRRRAHGRAWTRGSPGRLTNSRAVCPRCCLGSSGGARNASDRNYVSERARVPTRSITTVPAIGRPKGHAVTEPKSTDGSDRVAVARAAGAGGAGRRTGPTGPFGSTAERRSAPRAVGPDRSGGDVVSDALPGARDGGEVGRGKGKGDHGVVAGVGGVGGGEPVGRAGAVLPGELGLGEGVDEVGGEAAGLEEVLVGRL